MAQKYVVFIAGDWQDWDNASPEQQQKWMADHDAFGREVGAAILAGEALANERYATTMRRRDGQVQLTDGPFAESAESIGGFYLVEADDLDQVLRWCELLPAMYALEIRPCVEP